MAYSHSHTVKNEYWHQRQKGQTEFMSSNLKNAAIANPTPNTNT